eukprot:757549-Hanusia_phi.AAC.3
MHRALELANNLVSPPVYQLTCVLIGAAGAATETGCEHLRPRALQAICCCPVRVSPPPSSPSRFMLRAEARASLTAPSPAPLPSLLCR